MGYNDYLCLNSILGNGHQHNSPRSQVQLEATYEFSFKCLLDLAPLFQQAYNTWVSGLCGPLSNLNDTLKILIFNSDEANAVVIIRAPRTPPQISAPSNKLPKES